MPGTRSISAVVIIRIKRKSGKIRKLAKSPATDTNPPGRKVGRVVKEESGEGVAAENPTCDLRFGDRQNGSGAAIRPQAEQLDEMPHGVRHFVQTGEFGDAVDVVLAAGQVGGGQPLFG